MHRNSSTLHSSASISERKFAEKLTILNERGRGILTRVYNIKKVIGVSVVAPAYVHGLRARARDIHTRTHMHTHTHTRTCARRECGTNKDPSVGIYPSGTRCWCSVENCVNMVCY